MTNMKKNIKRFFATATLCGFVGLGLSNVAAASPMTLVATDGTYSVQQVSWWTDFRDSILRPFRHHHRPTPPPPPPHFRGRHPHGGPRYAPPRPAPRPMRPPVRHRAVSTADELAPFVLSDGTTFEIPTV